MSHAWPRMVYVTTCGLNWPLVVKAGRGDRNQFRHCDECQIDRRSTGWAEGVDLFVPAVARYPPGVRFARNCHIGSLGEGQI